MTVYPAVFSVVRPARFERVQLLLRALVFLVLSLAGFSLFFLALLLYLVIPIFSAIFISQKGSARFLAEDAPRLTRALRWVVGVYAYFALLTDRFPTGDPEGEVQFDVRPTGAPSVGTGLARLALSIPSALVLGLLGMVVGWIIWLVAAVMILISEDYPTALYDYQCGVMRWQARLFAYHASLVEEYPPFVLDMGPEPLTVS